MSKLLNRIDDLLEGKIDEAMEDLKEESLAAGEAETIRVSKIVNGDLTFGTTIGGELKDHKGRVVGKVEGSTVDPDTFNINLRLVIKADIWDRTEVVCEGNALDVDTEPMPDGRYKVRKRVNGYRPAVLDKEDVIELPKFESTKDCVAWVESLDYDDLRAYRQIYYDRWNFDSGDAKDRIYYELLDEELQGKSK